ncbi:MAG: glyceraldehyde-3-phosphate dehydrogenase 1 [Piccolia ochrophora]|nr:MAG: glyceraldehyde-3-phosphate dehydrogenase 1 [Piccolia ochrophora]
MTVLPQQRPTPPRPKEGLYYDFVDSFRRDPNRRVVIRGAIRSDNEPWDLEDGYEATAFSPLTKDLKSRHLQMIAVGAAIGAGLFINSGRLLSIAGPANLVLAFALVGTAVFATIHALGEMAVLFPISGSFSSLSTRFLDPAWGFAMGWNYAIQWLTGIPLEMVAASIAIDYWSRGGISTGVWITIYLVALFAANFLGVRAYGEIEMVLTSIKIVGILGFFIFAIAVDTGAGQQGYIGGKYWRDPGAFKNGFKGFCSVFVTAGLAYTGSELVGLCSAETRYPRQSIPTAVRHIFWRLFLFYVVSLLMVGLIVNSNDPRLNADGENVGVTKTSPFVIAITDAGVRGLDSVFNVIIMLACFEVGNTAVYASTRTMAALAEQRQAPPFMAYIDRKGRPLGSIGVALAMSLFAYLGVDSKESQIEVLLWFTSISGLGSFFTWGSICFCHIRFRKAWKEQGHSLNELAFRSATGVIGSWMALVTFIIILCLQLWLAIAPLGFHHMEARERVTIFFRSYFTVPMILLFFVTYKLVNRTSFVHTRDMNLSIGILKLSLEQILEEERARREAGPWWRRAFNAVKSLDWWLGLRDTIKRRKTTEVDYGWQASQSTK